MDELKKVGLKSTKTRNNILDLLKDQAPLSAEQIHKRLESEGVKLSSIYRNLSKFETENLLIKSIAQDGIAYYQLNSEKHKHKLSCTQCNTVVTIDECPLHDIEKKLEQDTGFTIKSHSFEFSGICKDCQDKN